VSAIYKKELRQYFHSVIGYAFLAIFLFVCGYFFSLNSLLYRSGDISTLFQSVVTVLMYLIPILTMRSFAEEKKIKTEQLLLTAPVSTTHIVLGKFLAAMSVFGIGLAVTLIYPVIIAIYGRFELWITLGNYLAVLLLVGAFVSIGVFVSAITENQVVAAILSYVVLFGLWFSSFMAGSVQSPLVMAILRGISLFQRFYELSMGIFNPASVVFYVSIIFVFLFLTVRVLESRRWN
jgi:ABC-2 type transport system permease protein